MIEQLEDRALCSASQFSVTFTAQVTFAGAVPPAGANPPPTGSVVFTIDGVNPSAATPLLHNALVNNETLPK